MATFRRKRKVLPKLCFQLCSAINCFLNWKWFIFISFRVLFCFCSSWINLASVPPLWFLLSPKSLSIFKKWKCKIFVIFNSHSLQVVFVRNHVLLENCVVSLETHTFVSVLREKQERTVRKQVGKTFKFVAERKSLPLHLIYFAIFPALN